jgi:hypothetical protein
MVEDRAAIAAHPAQRRRKREGVMEIFLFNECESVRVALTPLSRASESGLAIERQCVQVRGTSRGHDRVKAG